MIDINVKEGNILLGIKKSNSFLDIIQILKNHHCTYIPESKEWKLSISKYNTIYEELSDLDRIFLSEEDEKAIEALKIVPSQIKIYPNNKVITPLDLKIPPIKGRTPYENFQLEDINTLYHTNRFALYNEQGTGKSYILISNLDLLRKTKGIKKVLFLTSASGVYNIKKEFERFSDIPIDRVSIGGVKNRRPFSDTSIDIILCSYRSFLLISDEYQKDKKGEIKNYRKSSIPVINWLNGEEGILILDESHLIANPKARQTKVIHLVASYFEYRYNATGTPADRPEKHYSQLKILDPALIKDMSYYEWLEEYADIGTRFSPYAINYWKDHKTVELSQIVAKNCVRRFADQVLSLPEHFIRKYYVEFSPFQKEIYQRLVIRKMEDIQEEFGALNTRAVINSFPYLILAIDNPFLLLNHREKLSDVLSNDISSHFKFENHSKIEALFDILEKHEGEKVVLWTSHPSVANELYPLLEKKYCPLMINGETNIPKGLSLDEYKAKIINMFQKDSSHKILIAGEQVMNTSVSLVAANAQIYFDTDFSYTNFDQSLKRVYRIGQDKPVFTYRLIIDESLDVTRSKNIDGKDYFNKNFLTKEFVDKQTARTVFNMKGE